MAYTANTTALPSISPSNGSTRFLPLFTIYSSHLHFTKHSSLLHLMTHLSSHHRINHLSPPHLVNHPELNRPGGVHVEGALHLLGHRLNGLQREKGAEGGERGEQS